MTIIPATRTSRARASRGPPGDPGAAIAQVDGQNLSGLTVSPRQPLSWPLNDENSRVKVQNVRRDSCALRREHGARLPLSKA